jgi:DNA-binding CsgD family transcriptional regulator
VRGAAGRHNATFLGVSVTTPAGPSATRWAAAFASVRRVCAAGLGSEALRQEVLRRTAVVLPAEGHAFATADPTLCLLTQSLNVALPDSLVRSFMGTLYPAEEAIAVIDQAQARVPVRTTPRPAYADLLAREGVASELRAVFESRGALWGTWCLFRERGSRPFNEQETAFVRRLAPHLTHAFRNAARVDAAQAASESLDGEAPVPGVLVFAPGGRVVVRDARAERYLQDLADVGIIAHDVPQTLASALAQIELRERRAAMSRALEDATIPLHTRGHSGRWYTIHASLAEPDASGTSHIIVVVTPMSHGDRTPILCRMYGLTPREVAVLVRVARGASTREIAAALAVSPYTVQEHIGNAATKVGVRGRRALVAKLFFDGAAMPVRVRSGTEA